MDQRVTYDRDAAQNLKGWLYDCETETTGSGRPGWAHGHSGSVAISRLLHGTRYGNIGAGSVSIHDSIVKQGRGKTRSL